MKKKIRPKFHILTKIEIRITPGGAGGGFSGLQVTGMIEGFFGLEIFNLRSQAQSGWGAGGGEGARLQKRLVLGGVCSFRRIEKRIFDPRFARFRGRKEREIRNWICNLSNLSPTRAICTTASQIKESLSSTRGNVV